MGPTLDAILKEKQMAGYEGESKETKLEAIQKKINELVEEREKLKRGEDDIPKDEP